MPMGKRGKFGVGEWASTPWFPGASQLVEIKEAQGSIQLRFWGNPNRSFLLASAPRGSYNPRTEDIGQP